MLRYVIGDEAKDQTNWCQSFMPELYARNFKVILYIIRKAIDIDVKTINHEMNGMAKNWNFYETPLNFRDR